MFDEVVALQKNTAESDEEKKKKEKEAQMNKDKAAAEAAALANSEVDNEAALSATDATAQEELLTKASAWFAQNLSTLQDKE
jgi:hypothetical protein